MNSRFWPPLLLTILFISAPARAEGLYCDLIENSATALLVQDGETFSQGDSKSRLEVKVQKKSHQVSYFQYIANDPKQFLEYTISCTQTQSCSGYRREKYGKKDQKAALHFDASSGGTTGSFKNRAIVNHHVQGNGFSVSFLEGFGFSSSGFEVKCHE